MTTTRWRSGDLGRQVAGHQDGPTLTPEVAQEGSQPPYALGVQPVGRFVQDQDLGVAEQGGGQAQALAHADREAAHPPVGGGGELDLVEHGIDPGWIDAAGRSAHPKVVAVRPGWASAASRATPTWWEGLGSCGRGGR
jgi:hypothetical protein